MSRRKFIAVVAVLVILLCTGVQTPPAQTDTFTGFDGMEYTVSFDEQTNEIGFTVYNPLDITQETRYAIMVDGWVYANVMFELSPGETHRDSFNITDGIDVGATNHTVTFSTYGAATNFTFVREYDTLHPGDVPVQRITNIEVATGTARGEDSTVVYVTVENPSKTGYVSHVVAYTEETSASSGMANPLPGESQTVKLELREPIGSVVEGEIRMFMGKPNETEGALAQVEFSGTAGSETSYEREQYVPFSLHGPDGGYSYASSGGSAEIVGVSGVPEYVQWVTAVGVGAFLLALVVWWRR